jgi:hypothetical protein
MRVMMVEYYFMDKMGFYRHYKIYIKKSLKKTKINLVEWKRLYIFVKQFKTNIIQKTGTGY